MRPAEASYDLPRVKHDPDLDSEPQIIKCTVKSPKGKLVTEVRKLESVGAKLEGQRTILANEISSIEARIAASPLTRADELSIARTKTEADKIVDNPEYYAALKETSHTRLAFAEKLEALYPKFDELCIKIDANIDEQLKIILNVSKGDEDLTIGDIDFEEIPRDQKLEISNFFAQRSNGNTKKSNA